MSSEVQEETRMGVIDQLRRPIDMAPATGTQIIIWGIALLFLLVSLLSIWMVTKSSPGTATRDLFLVLMGALLATTASFFLYAIRVEIRARREWRKLTFSYISERVGNIGRLDGPSTYTADVTVDGQEIQLIVPLDRLRTTSLEELKKSHVISCDRIGELHVEYRMIDRFNYLSEILSKWVDSILSNSNPQPHLIRGARRTYEELQTIREDLLERYGSEVEERS